jgi:hypothetical protein
VENLVSRQAYNAVDYSIRLPLVIGIFSCLLGGLFFGLFFTLAFELLGSLVLPSPLRIFNVRMVILVGLAFGVPFGLCLALAIPAGFRKRMASFTDALYAGDPKIVELPASVDDYSHRLPCSWMKSDKFSVGGVLYLSRERFMFAPHNKNLPQHREAFEIAPLNDVTFSMVQLSNFMARLLLKKLPPYLEITWSSGKARFVIPDPEHTLMRIKGIAE